VITECNMEPAFVTAALHQVLNSRLKLCFLSNVHFDELLARSNKLRRLTVGKGCLLPLKIPYPQIEKFPLTLQAYQTRAGASIPSRP